MKLCPSCGTEKAVEEFYKHPNTYCKECTKQKMSDQSLVRRYGITRDDWNQMFEAQKGCCKICHRHQSEFKQSLYTDHCHKTGKVRGLLCGQCNRVLGMFNDDISRFQESIEYLRAAAEG